MWTLNTIEIDRTRDWNDFKTFETSNLDMREQWPHSPLMTLCFLMDLEFNP